MNQKYKVSPLRTLALAAQGLITPLVEQENKSPTEMDLLSLVKQLGCIQIDTLQMVHRSQYLVPWSRLGDYDTAMLDDMLFGKEKRLFEGWQHAASIIPIEDYRYQLPRQIHIRENNLRSWLDRKQENQALFSTVLERIKREGPLRAADFEYDGPRRDSWWDWKPAKEALEFQYHIGNLMIANRSKFQRVYGLKDHILPNWVDETEPTPAERDRFWIEKSVKALGVCTPSQAADYTWMKIRDSKPAVTQLLNEGVLVEIQVELEDKSTQTMLIHTDNLPLLDQVCEGSITPDRTTFLSPFDSVFWAKGRDQMLWGFQHLIEMYFPAVKRKHGYYCMPILHMDRFVGRIDPKLLRKEKHLVIKSVLLDDKIKPDEELVIGIASALKNFMKFHNAIELTIEKSNPEFLKKKILSSM